MSVFTFLSVFKFISYLVGSVEGRKTGYAFCKHSGKQILGKIDYKCNALFMPSNLLALNITML